MADFDEAASVSSEDGEQLWSELDRCVSTQCDSHEAIDDALREWVDVATKLRDRSPGSQEEVAICAQMLLQSKIFRENKDYVRTQIIHSLLQEDDPGPLHAISCLLLLDGQNDETTFPRMVDENCFPRILELVNVRRDDEDARLHRLLLQLLYETSRMERLKVEHLGLVEDQFIHHMFRIIEGVSNDVHDPYHYPIIRVLLVLNEQYMLASTDLVTGPSSSPPAPLTNRIVKCLSLHGPSFRTFGENIILLLNRETETSLQLLILKLLYLLFTTKATYEYFYTNDLRVLLDVIIRNLMDLPDEKMSLRHTYLRVLYPLLAHTQLSQPPHYKQEEVLRVLTILRGSQNAHFAPADETTLRLVERVTKIPWIEEAATAAGAEDDEEEEEEEVEGDKESQEKSEHAEVSQKLLGISLSPTEYASAISVGDVAEVMERPGVQTPSRSASLEGVALASREDEATGTVKIKKPLPAIPKHRHGTPFAPTNTHINGSPAKKVPPKAPPPRRWGKMKTVEQASVESLQQPISGRDAE